MRKLMAVAFAVFTGMVVYGAGLDWQSVDAEKISEMMKAMKVSHPRLFGGTDPAAVAKANAAIRPGKLLATKILHDAGVILNSPVAERVMVGRRMMGTSVLVSYRVNTLSLAFLLTGNEQFARRAAAEMVGAAKFSDWNPKHFLDVAEMTLGLAFGYDMLYDKLTPDEREIISEAIIEKGLKPSLVEDYSWWVSGTNNWTQVCHAGCIAGALAIYEKDPALAENMILRAVKNLPKIMKISYYPNGAYPEGPIYWGYGTDFNAISLMMLQNAFHTDFGLSEAAGFDKTCDFIDAVEMPSGLWFSYADGSPRKRMLSFADLYLMKRFNREDRYDRLLPLLNEYSALPVGWESEGRRLLPAILFFMPDLPEKPSDKRPLHYYSGDDAKVPIAIHRSGHGPGATFLGLKAGSPSASHGHMDVGSFVIESGGVYWAWDLGREPYDKLELRGVKLWDRSQNGDRWKIFRLGKNSHNILVIDGENQTVAGNAKITSSSERATEMDLTNVYAGKVQKAVRRAELMPDGSITVTDTLSGLNPESVVKWQMCTKRNIDAGDNPGALKLSERGKIMRLQAETNKNPAVLKITPWRQLANENDSDNGSASMISFESRPDAKGDLSIRVIFF